MHRYELKRRVEQDLLRAEHRDLTVEDLKRERMDLSSLEPWPALCCYKLSGSPEGDCDVSLMSMVCFSIALGCGEQWAIARQPGRVLNYQLVPRGPESWVLRGDTMNSYATTFHRYLRLLDQEREADARLNSKGENWEEVVLRDPAAASAAVSTAALVFLKRTHTIGNMIPVPCRISETGSRVTASFNAPRYARTKDYWDLTLLCLWHHYTGQTDGTHTLEWLLPDPANQDLCRAWLGSFGQEQAGWDRFVEQNLLMDFVNAAPGEGYGGPRELWPGHFTGDVMPNKEQCEAFFVNTSCWIAARSLRIALKAREVIAQCPSRAELAEKIIL